MKFIKHIVFGLGCILILMMITATILEKTTNTEAVSPIYTSPLFTTIWIVFAVCSCIYIINRKLQRNVFTFLLHISFLIILSGAFTTRLCGQQGTIRLRMDNSYSSTFTSHDKQEKSLPFSIQLSDFHIDYYKGSFAPMDFISKIRIFDKDKIIQGEVSMNKILSYRHYRFYQSSYDNDMKGTTLSISYDPWGIGITYAGYSLLLVSIIGFLFQKNSGFRKLLSHPMLHRSTALVCMAILSSSTTMGSELPKHLSRETASALGDLYIYYNDRICPLQTLAKDFTLKIYGKSNYKGLTPEQVFTGWFFFYDDWKTEPMIYIKHQTIQQSLGISSKYACLHDFFFFFGYKLKNAETEMQMPKKRELNETNEKINLIGMLTTGDILKIYPHQTTNGKIQWFAPTDELPKEATDEQRLFIRKSLGLFNLLISKKDDDNIIKLAEKIKKYQQKTAASILPSEAQFKAEKLYNEANYTKLLAMGCLTIGIISFIFYCKRMGRKRQTSSPINTILLFALGIVSVYLLSLMGLRGFISSHIPLSNGYETMQFMAFCTTLLTFFSYRKFEGAIAFGYMLCGLSLLVSMLGESNPPITQLMPVLSSPLLSIHVVTIMLAYSLTAFIMLNGLMAIVIRHTQKNYQPSIERLHIISQVLLYPAVFLLTIGIFIGSIWANVSWGRYWGWDPKETWALITLLVYATAQHSASFPLFRKPMSFHWFSILAFLSVLITYFGVNFLLGGIHSYA